MLPIVKAKPRCDLSSTLVLSNTKALALYSKHLDSGYSNKVKQSFALKVWFIKLSLKTLSEIKVSLYLTMPILITYKICCNIH